MSPSVESVSAATAKVMLNDGKEIAFLDVREHGQYGEGHPFFAVNCPFSRLEIEVVLLVPNPGCRILLIDEGDGVSDLAAKRLKAIGYSHVLVLEGGAPGWEAAGFVLFKGVNVPSKAFGELVEHAMGTPSVSAEELKAMIDAGENMLVLDGRSPAEFNRMNIPTARSCPNGELAYRIAALAPDPSTKVVINCAGRTRSIIGSQTLRNLKIPNEVFALRNGSQGWQLAGFSLEHGNEPGILSDPDPVASEDDETRRISFIKEQGICTIDPETLAQWRVQTEQTTFVLDVRTREEFLAGHLPGAIHAPGGQLVQATDQWVGTRNARIVLCDNKSVRAAMTCYWLSLMGHDCVVLDRDVTRLSPVEKGKTPDRSALPAVTFVNPAELGSLGQAVLLDVSASQEFREAHVSGACWAIRPRLSRLNLPADASVVVMARDPRVAMLAAADIDRQKQGQGRVHVLDGGFESWRAAGLEFEATPNVPDDSERIDFLFFVHDRHDGVLASARTYLKWETELLGKMDSAERGVFKRLNALQKRENR